eukprot:TRINITY_DN22002_c0_g1_i2.p1 TRINITY_DN22002_c0_g1~~TRINITY_DN22002_c0_g1_i2.p1  ORF type:complete len:220 (-),score=32.91 TRINITY_DN22002_c0_g1_i2:631-1290(-)
MRRRLLVIAVVSRVCLCIDSIIRAVRSGPDDNDVESNEAAGEVDTERDIEDLETTELADGVCKRTYHYPPHSDYIAKMKQGKPSDPSLVGIASIANRVYNFASPVAGWEIGWMHEYTAENCDYNQNVAIYRKEENGLHRCALTFAGTDQWIADNLHTNFDSSLRDFCGFEQIHQGYVDRLQRLLEDEKTFSEVTAYLNDKQKCQEVLMVGHSLGTLPFS